MRLIEKKSFLKKTFCYALIDPQHLCGGFSSLD